MTGEAPFYADVAEAPEGAAPRWLRARDGKRIRAVFWTGGARGTVLVLPGRTEYIEKYGAVIGRLRALGFGAAVIDWRGQGLSDRYPPYPERGHVEDFRAYQDDLDALLAAPEVARGPRPLLLLCHSMGGCVGLRALIERPELAAGVFSAPMWGIRVGRVARILVGPLTGTAVRLGLGHRGMPGAARGAPPGMEGNPLTSDSAAFLRAARQIAEHPELGLGPPSVRWTSAAFREIAALRRLPSPSRPMLGFLGSDETVVDPADIRARFARTPDAELVPCPGARHEILMERPETQTLVWSRIAAFLDRVAPG
ncbi:alpha/beta hydrolase [Amaricoccus solimangrovi]|uniref:Alpha/beta hydrolase n=1 Tax=Amaricoccus solimangrovi TaxID=2589815 RepID=A0A501WHR1_9RHOB|nr:alpha/beta hydrolase [Amaricoccus solimangrovi]TPE48322.1 alpha/beta hydrolase [Amaricoccus solimangrovi]